MSTEIDDLLALLAQLDEPTASGEDALTEADADDPLSDPDDDSSWVDPPEEVAPRELSHGELTLVLHRFVLPNVNYFINTRGYLNLGNLARAAHRLQGSAWHLARVRQVVQRADVPVFPARSDRSGRTLPLVAIEQALHHFGDLVHGEPDPAIVVARLGYADLPLRDGTRLFLLQAWTHHCLARSEEQHHAEVVAAAVAAHGTAYRDWPAEALHSRELLVLDNLWLVSRVARKYVRSGIDIDDLLQAGQLGLLRAVEKQDPTRGNRFVTYASNWVYQAITRYIADHSSLIRLPVHRHEQRGAIVAARDHLYQELGRPPALRAIAQACDVDEDVVKAILVTARPISLDDAARCATIRRLRDPLDLAGDTEDRLLGNQIDTVLASLTDRERSIIEQRFGLLDGHEYTLEEVGRGFGLTRERIRQIEAKALRRLNHPSRRKLLESFSEDPPAIKNKVPLPSLNKALLVLAAERLKPRERKVITALLNLDGDKPRSRQSILKRYNLSSQEANTLETRLRATALGLRVNEPPAATTILLTHDQADGTRLTYTRYLQRKEPCLSPRRLLRLAFATEPAGPLVEEPITVESLSEPALAPAVPTVPAEALPLAADEIPKNPSKFLDTHTIRDALGLLGSRLTVTDFLIADALFGLTTGVTMPRDRVAAELYVPLERVIDVEAAIKMFLDTSPASALPHTALPLTLGQGETCAQDASTATATPLQSQDSPSTAAALAAAPSLEIHRAHVTREAAETTDQATTPEQDPSATSRANLGAPSPQERDEMATQAVATEPAATMPPDAQSELNIAATPEPVTPPEVAGESITAASTGPQRNLSSPSFAHVWAVLPRFADQRERSFISALYGLHATKPLSSEDVAAAFDAQPSHVANVDRALRILVNAADESEHRDEQTTVLRAPTAAQLMLLRRAKRQILAQYSTPDARILLARYGPANQAILPGETIADALNVPLLTVETLSAQFEQRLADHMRDARRPGQMVIGSRATPAQP